MTQPIIIQCGRRIAVIEGKHIRLEHQDNLRKPARPVRQGDKTLASPILCWHAGLLWALKGAIDFGEGESHRRRH